MAIEPEKQEEIESHPLYPILNGVHAMRAEAEQSGDTDRADTLDQRISMLTEKIASDLDIPNPIRDNPQLQELESLWDDLREARRSGRSEEEETIWTEIAALSEKIDAKKVFSNN
ncbi:MAG: hypothetical protein HYV90_05820 [Candidatus Woesebacteria bacterium]|nr:MAG: hypothetical protein HYV90_05820 [Candidatus Woesebacteria bacterium]